MLEQARAQRMEGRGQDAIPRGLSPGRDAKDFFARSTARLTSRGPCDPRKVAGKSGAFPDRLSAKPLGVIGLRARQIGHVSP